MVHSDPHMSDSIDLPVPRRDVEIKWHRNDLQGEKKGAKGNGIAGNGTIAACTFHGRKDTLVIYDYDGHRLWNSKSLLNQIAVSSTPMVSIDNRVIACDNKTILMVEVDVNNNQTEIVWQTDIPNKQGAIIIPFSPTLVENKTIVLPTTGPVYAFDAQDGTFLGSRELGEHEAGYFSTINSACAHGHRIYISTEFRPAKGKLRKNLEGRLYAVDVNRQADETLAEAWYFPFTGHSQASPLLIDNTVYFDGYLSGFSKKPHIYAVTDLGEHYTTISLPYPYITMFSFSKDPRLGFWYEDYRGSRLIHFVKEDHTIRQIEEIRIDKLVPSGVLLGYKPLSCMTICDFSHPVMLISAASLFPRQYITALDLTANNSILWQFPMNGWNYAGGQFTILTKNDNPEDNRILFGSYWDGVIALGSKES